MMGNGERPLSPPSGGDLGFYHSTLGQPIGGMPPHAAQTLLSTVSYESSRKSSAPPSSSIGSVNTSGLLPFLTEGRFADALLHIRTSDNKISSLPVHRIILAYRSSFFNELFSNPTQTAGISSKGLPIYHVPILPAHRSRHEVLGLCLWWIYSLDDGEVTLPETKWDQVVGIHRVSDIFRLARLNAYAENLLRTAIEKPTTPTDEIHVIAQEARIWGVPGIERRAMEALMDRVMGSESSDQILATTSFDAFATIAGHTDLVKNFDLVRRYVAIKSKSSHPLDNESINALWSQVPFELLMLPDLDAAYRDPQVPRQFVLRALANKLASEPSALNEASPELFRATLEHGSIPDEHGGTIISPAVGYEVVRNYIATHPGLGESVPDSLWRLVRFAELSAEEFEQAFQDGYAPQNVLLKAMVIKLRSPQSGNMSDVASIPSISSPSLSAAHARPSVHSVPSVTPVATATPMAEPRNSAENRSLHTAGSVKVPYLKLDLDWNALINSKKGHWEDLTVDVTKKQMDDVVTSWSAIKRDDATELFGKLTKECLFSQNPNYERLYSSPESFPFIKIIDTIATQTHRSLGRNHREVVADLFLIGHMHKAKLELGLEDYKAMVAGVVYAIGVVRAHVSEEQRAREARAWQVLLSEMSVLLARGEKMTDEEVKLMMREVHGGGTPVKRGGNYHAGAGRGRPADRDKCSVM
ncbi:hypothetical protein M427DRAFT_153002 [Gonapodya prolifera JEL478]|uniref:BTB domain-containing protein n=1 Tax=Gonapodya prolifera (strain JEL478) TaxID=1344416 RepID=A0A139APL8_GONPJ|nr:hypothetical protein M427DRAFT_153002 [Gonapodya prolifera JEL478]|eukprot:KXS18594.1 hypothetical protein M427DRAFT_153002 [Gonapodya prolifera JEL478]